MKLKMLGFLIPILFLCLLCKEGVAQPATTVYVAPDCLIFVPFVPPGTTTSVVLDNRFLGCQNWTLEYENTGYTPVNVALQSANGATTAGSFVNFAGTIVNGVNPNTSVTGAVTTFTNGTVSIPWVRIAFNNITGTGTMTGILYGWKGGGGSGGGGSGGCVGTASIPCVVDGPVAAGSPPTKPPVLTAGQDGTNTQTFKTDTAGDTLVAGGVANGSAVKNPLVTGTQDSSGNALTDFSCDKQAAITLSSSSGLLQIIAASAGKSIRVCHLDFANNTGVNVTIVSGTQVSTPCDTTPANLSGVYQTVVTFAMDYSPKSPLTTAASQALCLNFGATVTTGGVVVYEQK